MSAPDFRIYNVKDIIEMEERERVKMTPSDKLASRITAYTGSITFIVVHIVWFLLWLLVNLNFIPGVHAFDPFPFNFLTMMVSLEAIFLSTFVLISQNKQAMQSEKRAKVDLQVNMIAERENTKLLKMLLEIEEHLGIRRKADSETRELERNTNINILAEEIDKEEEKMEGPRSKSPESAIDTDK